MARRRVSPGKAVAPAAPVVPLPEAVAPETVAPQAAAAEPEADPVPPQPEAAAHAPTDLPPDDAGPDDAGSEAAPAPVPIAWDTRFDADLYAAMNPDIAAAMLRGETTAEEHWIWAGEREQRAGARPSVGHQLHLAPPRAGRREGSDVPDAAMAQFEPAGYGFLNHDLRPLISQDGQVAHRHWLSFGLVEGRFAPGWRPNAGRKVSVAGLLARPRGIDLYAPFGDFGPLGRLARRLAFALAGGGIAHSFRAFDLGTGQPRVPKIERERPGFHRVSLMLCPPAALQALIDNFAPDYFDTSYVIALWPADWRPLLREILPPDGAADEIWVGSQAGVAALAPYVSASLHAVSLPVEGAGDAADRLAARAALGLSPTARALLFSLDDLLPPGSAKPADDLARAQLQQVLDAFCRLPPDAENLLLVQAPRDPMLATFGDLLEASASERIVVFPAPATFEADRQLQAASDILLCGGEGIGDELRAASFAASGRPVIAVAGGLQLPGVLRVEADRLGLDFVAPGHRHVSAPVFRPGDLLAAMQEAIGLPLPDRGAVEPAIDERRFVAEAAARIEALGLDAEPLAFTRSFGAGTGYGQPTIFEGLQPRSRDQVERLVQRPFFDVLVAVRDGVAIEPSRVAACLESLAQQTYKLFRIHLVCATDTPEGASLRGFRAPGVVPPREGVGFLQAFDEAVAACTGSHVVLVEAEATVKPWALTELAIGSDSRAEAAFCAESEIEGRRTDRSHASQALTSVFDAGPMLSVPHKLLTSLLPLPPALAKDTVFVVAAHLLARPSPVEILDEVLTTLPASLAGGTDAVRAEVLGAIAASDGARLLSDPLSGVTRLAPPLERLPQVTVIVTAIDRGVIQAALGTLRRLSQTRYKALQLALIAAQSLEGNLPLDELHALGVELHLADANGDVQVLRQRGLISATTPLVAFVGHTVSFSDDWLAELAEPALSAGFGAAGVRVAAGGPNPAHARGVAAVDGACLLVDRVAALGVGGFRARAGEAAGVGLCLALREQGARVVVVPGAGVELPPPVSSAALFDELRNEWGDLSPETFASPVRPLRQRLPRESQAPAGPDLRIRPQAPAVSAPIPAPPSQFHRPSGWRRSV